MLIKCGLKHKLLPGYFLSLAAAHSLQCCHNSLITFSKCKCFVHRSIEIERLAIKTVKIVVHGRIHINNFFDKSDLCFRAWNFFTFVFFSYDLSNMLEFQPEIFMYLKLFKNEKVKRKTLKTMNNLRLKIT